jgi:hypothetical protein
MQSNTIACHKCRHYQVTWDARLPYGCRAHGFKTRKNPALAVYEASGIECQLFESKEPPDSSRRH